MIRKFNPQNIPPPSWKVEFPKEIPFLDVEIGCGVGFHPLWYIQKNPDRFLLAIEKTTNKFNKFWRRYHSHGAPKNLAPIHANAVAWVVHNIQKESVDRYFILYPNPYPKDPQKRFFQMPFMSYLIETLKPQGQITLATNELFYYEESRDLGTQHWGLNLVEDRVLTAQDFPRTHFEKKYLERGESCYNLVFSKT